MKLLTVFGLLYVGFCAAKLDEQQLRDLLATSKICYKELDISADSDMLQRLLYNNSVNYTDEVKNYNLCMLQKIGWMDADGTVIRQALLDFYYRNESFDRQQVREMVDSCIKAQPQEVVALEKAVAFTRCCHGRNRQFDL